MLLFFHSCGSLSIIKCILIKYICIYKVCIFRKIFIRPSAFENVESHSFAEAGLSATGYQETIFVSVRLTLQVASSATIQVLDGFL